MSLDRATNHLSAGQDLSIEDARYAFDVIFSGTINEDTIANFLLGLRTKGETVNEILGAVQSMRSHMLTVKAPPDAIDIVGTGGDGHNTVNVSTASAVVVAACGVPVAKHGNRSASSRSGSSDMLAALGVRLDPPLTVLEQCLADANLCFLFAPVHHPSMRHVAQVRKKIGVRTIFNLLGPLTNPANVKRHMIGVYDLEWLGPMAEVLKRTGSEAAWLAHGQDGLDEISTTSETDIVELRQGGIRHFSLSPETVRLPRVSLSDLKGGDGEANAQAFMRLLNGKKGPYRDIVLFNAAAALIVGQRASELGKAMNIAESALDSGAALRTLQTLIRLTNESGS